MFSLHCVNGMVLLSGTTRIVFKPICCQRKVSYCKHILLITLKRNWLMLLSPNTLRNAITSLAVVRMFLLESDKELHLILSGTLKWL